MRSGDNTSDERLGSQGILSYENKKLKMMEFTVGPVTDRNGPGKLISGVVVFLVDRSHLACLLLTLT